MSVWNTNLWLKLHSFLSQYKLSVVEQRVLSYLDPHDENHHETDKTIGLSE